MKIENGDEMFIDENSEVSFNPMRLCERVINKFRIYHESHQNRIPPFQSKVRPILKEDQL